MKDILYIDVETRSCTDIGTAGSYKYMEDSNFEVILLAYALNEAPVRVVDLLQGEDIPQEFITMLLDVNIELHAYNANFERNVFKKLFDFEIPITRWYCTMAKAAIATFPLNLKGAGDALNIDNAKLDSGKDLIKKFCLPIPANVDTDNGMTPMFEVTPKLFINPQDAPQDWEEFKRYNGMDVEAEREIDDKLSYIEISKFERATYILDQIINDNGIKVDLDFIYKAEELGEDERDTLFKEMRQLTGLDNPNSTKQLKEWLEENLGHPVQSTRKEYLQVLAKSVQIPIVKRVLENRLSLNKSSISKYTAMDVSVQNDGRVRGLFQYGGANRTLRWAGRRVQLQNLPRNNSEPIELARELVCLGDTEGIELLFGNINELLSELIRTAIVPAEGHIFKVADFSAIEARVLSWMAGEQWRLDVFTSHGKIYEAAAALMFNVPIESIGHGSPERGKGKIAELALGYQGGVNALKQMGGERMGLTEPEMKYLVDKWRDANPNIVKYWYALDNAAKRAVFHKESTRVGLVLVGYENNYMYIRLPSGRKLYYNNATDTMNQWGQKCIKFMGITDTGVYGWVDTYGGKLTENVTQAIARDILAISMLRLHKAGFKIVMHVHDEAIAEVPLDSTDLTLEIMCEIMGRDISWAPGLPLNAEGFETIFYKKD